MFAKIQNRVSGLFGLNKGIQQTQRPCVKETVYGLKTSDSKAVPLKSVETNVNIKGFVAEVVATLKYNNEESSPVETVFTFPLGDTIGLYGFEASIDDRKIVTEVQETKQTVDIEEENTRGHVFHCTLGTLPAGKDARLILSFVIELHNEPDGRVRFTLPSPLNPRYHTGESTATPDEDVQWCTAPYRLTMSAIIEGYSQIKSVKSEKLELNVEIEKGDNIAEVTLGEEFRYDHDLTFHIEYRKPFAPRLIMESGNPEKESMTGRHMQFAKDALLVFLKNLPANCLFNIVGFGTSYASLFPGYSVYDVTSLKKALELQGSMQADMETTNLYKVLDHVLNLDVQNPHRNIFLLTDGEVDNQSDVISLIKKQTDQNRVFVLGFGCTSTSIVKAMARAGNGIAEVVYRKAQIESKVMTLLQCAILNTVSVIELVWDLPPDVTPVTIPTVLPNVLTVGQRLHFFAILSGATKSETNSAERKSVLDTVKRAVGLQDRPKPFKFSRMSYSPSEMQRAITFENSRGGQRLVPPKRPMTCIEPSMSALASRQQEALDQDDELFQVVQCQELPGNWSPSKQLNDLMNINDDKLKSIETLPGLVLFDDRAEVLYTLAVVAWLRKCKQARKSEWWLNEMKAILWLGEKGLGKPLDDILKEVHDAIMKT